jgi:iron(III) transport system ATP-binding protein
MSLSPSGSETSGRAEGAPGARARLTLSHVSHRYGRLLAVDDVSLTLPAGEFVCLLGPSGCGKSSLLRVIAGLQRQTSGQVLIDGEEVAGPVRFVPPENRGVGLMFQDYALFPHLNVLGNVAFGLSAYPRAKRREMALEALEIVGMAKFAKSYPHTLSGGEQQRVALARALAPRPRIMLLDEPFSGLDRKLRDAVREETLTILRRSGASCVMVTHDPEEAMLMADRIALMRNGRLVQFGAPDELFFTPVDAEAAEFFSKFNRLHGVVQNGLVLTPFGGVPANSLVNGTGAEVLIRPEQMSLVTDAEEYGIRATVLRCIPVGSQRLVEAELADGTRVQARMSLQACPPVGAEIALTFNPGAALVFPCRCGREKNTQAHSKLSVA